jgi:cobalamin biosynthesis Mg chelatase CobN
VAAVIFNFPPNAGNTGTAAFLSVFESLHNTMAALQREGYSIELPASVDELRERIVNGNAQRHGAAANVHARIAADEHVRRERHLKEIEAQWGPAPGKQQSDGASIFVLGERFGNLFVGIQPAFGYEGDPMRLLFEKGFAPTHAFSAFYRWLKEDFNAHAVLHFGTHGALEFMPGKQAGLSGDCWPDRLIGDLPNFYLYASNNPSEGTIAKRRAAATLISYLTPPVAQAGLYRGLIELKGTLDRYRSLEPKRLKRELATMIQAQAAELELAPAEPAWADPRRPDRRLNEAVLDRYTLIPHGLHVVGQAPSPVERTDLLLSLAEASHGRRRSLSTRWSRAGTGGIEGTPPAETLRCCRTGRDAQWHDHELDACARPGRLRAPRAGRRRAAHAGDPADRAQPARLRPLPHPQRLCRQGRHAPVRAAAAAPPGRRPCLPGKHRAGAVGHRQPEDRRRADRPGPGPPRRQASLRQLRPPGRRRVAAAGAVGPAARGRDRHAVRHLP